MTRVSSDGKIDVLQLWIIMMISFPNVLVYLKLILSPQLDRISNFFNIIANPQLANGSIPINLNTRPEKFVGVSSRFNFNITMRCA